MVRLKFLVILTLVTSGLSIAQQPTYYLNPNKKLYQFNLETWSTKDGLPTNSIINICQSKLGYLWIGSYDGLIRFDGYNFKIFHKYNTPAFKSNTIRRIIESEDKTLWMTTQGSGLVSFKNGNFNSYGPDKNILNLYRGMYIDEDERIWSASPDSGWFIFKNGNFKFLHHNEPLKDIEVRAITKDYAGAMWFGTLGHGLYRYKNGIFETFTTSNGLQNNWIYAVYTDTRGRVWIGSNAGLSFYNGKTFEVFKIPEIGTVNDILEDEYGNIWLGSTTGLYRINTSAGEIEHLDANKGLRHNFINDITIDREGALWMANYKGGLSQLKDGKFTNYTAIGGLHGKVVNAICELDTNKYLAAFDNGYLSLIDKGKIRRFSTKNKLSGNRVRHILKDKNNNLWFSTYSGLLKVSSNGNESWYNRKSGFPGSQIRMAFEDSRGRIWVGSRNTGLVRINKDNSFTVFNVSNGLSSNLIMSIEEAPNGNILVGTSEGIGGLNIISGDTIIAQFSMKDGLISNVIFNTYTDSTGIIWIATNAGLSYLMDNKITSHTMADGLLDDSPYDILEDMKGNLWLPCSKGLMRVNKDELLTHSKDSSNDFLCTLFNHYDGMHQAECNPTTKSLKALDGTFLIPTIDGITQIDPLDIPVNNFIPQVILEDIVTDNEFVKPEDNISIESGIKRITFKYTALSLYEPEKIVFRYRLIGFEDKWADAGNKRTVSYTNLPPGRYNFRVIASNNDGVWNNVGTSIHFKIEPHFHETGWFIFFIGITILALIYSVYLIRIKHLKSKQLDLERMVFERTKEITVKNTQLEKQKNEISNQARKLEVQKQELKISNASKDKMFSIIAHDLRGPLGNFKSLLDIVINDHESYDNSEREEMLLMLSDNAKSTYELLDNLLNWSVSQRGMINYEPVEFAIVPIINDIFSIVMPMAIKKGINIICNVDETVTVLADVNMTRLILRNLISNAIKFTAIKGEISVHASVKGRFCEFGVKDNGVGMNEDVKNKLFDQLESNLRIGTNLERGSGLGLLLCKEFIEKNNGQIRVESTPGIGSTFYFTLQRGNI